jgi:hypothetical protein
MSMPTAGPSPMVSDGVPQVVDTATRRTNLTSHMPGPNAVVYLTVGDGDSIAFSTLIDVPKNRPVGCVYPIKVTDGSVLGKSTSQRRRSLRF